MAEKGVLYMIPCPISDSTAVYDVVPQANGRVIDELDYFIVENIRSARRFLSKAGISRKIDDLEFVEAVTISEEVADLTYNDFHLYTSEGEDVTESLLQRSGRVVLLCINDGEISGAQMRGIEQLRKCYGDENIVIISASKVDDEWCHDIEQLSIDAMTLRSMMRADIGVVVLSDGVVESKANIRDL